MAIFIITGATGSGKSLKQCEFGLKQCQEKRKSLVTNFSINLPALQAYAKHKKYGWLSHMIDRNMITYVDANQSLAQLLSFPNSVVLLDEAGIFLNVGEWQKTPKKLLYDLCQSRKDGVDVVAAAQFDEQIHRQFRELAHNIIEAQGVTKYDRITKRPKLVWKTYFYFDALAYRTWQTSRDRGSYLRTRVRHAFLTEHGFIDDSDKLLFKIFDSYARLDKPNIQPQLGFNYSMLPFDYYAPFARSAAGEYKHQFKRDNWIWGDWQNEVDAIPSINIRRKKFSTSSSDWFPELSLADYDDAYRKDIGYS